MKKVQLIYGNQKDRVQEARYNLIRRFLPNGEEDGEVIDIRPPGNQPLKLDKAWSRITEELGTVSLIPDAKRLVIVHNLTDFKTANRGSVREKKRASGGKIDPVAKLDEYIRGVLFQSPHALLFIYEEDDEKGRFLAKTSSIFQMIQSLGDVQAFQEKRLDWQLEEAILSRDMNGSLNLAREWIRRGGNAPFRITTTLNQLLQLVMQARLMIEAQQSGLKTTGLYKGLRPSIETIPDFKKRKLHQFALSYSSDRIIRSLERLNQIQKSFFPKGTELIVHDPLEQIEILLLDLTARK